MASKKGVGIKDEVIKGIFDGKIKNGQIDPDLYMETAEELTEAVTKTLGLDFKFDEPDNVLRYNLQNNLHVFSGAKSLAMFEEIRSKLTDEDGKPRSFSEFKKDVLKIDEQYNTNWLRAEYNQAIAQSQNAKNWQRYEDDKDLYPNLKYVTAGDDRVRNEHAALDGIVRPVDDAFWNTYAPQNGWGCRCTLEQMDEDADVTKKETAFGQAEGVIKQKMFKDNVGKSQVIMRDNHPYFKLAKDQNKNRTTEFKATVNYGMKSANEIMLKNTKAKEIKSSLNSIEEYEKWWGKQIEKTGTGNDKEFVLDTLLGYKVTMDKQLFNKSKTIEKERYKHIENVPETLSSPDEVWNIDNSPINYKQANISTAFIKYYKNDVFVVITNVKGQKRLRVKSFYIPEDKEKYSGTEELRRGVLMYRK